MDKINAFLDKFVLPWPVRYLTHRFVILCTLLLIIPLILFAANTVFVLTANSYLNTMSVAVSSIVLLYATIADLRDKKIAEMQENRAQEDHSHVTDMHQMILDSVRNQSEEIERLKEILAQLQGKEAEVQKAPARPKVDVRSLHKRGAARFSDEDIKKRLARALRSHLPGEQ